MSPVDFKKWQCCMSLSLINAHVECQIQERAMSHVTFFFDSPSHVSNPNVDFRFQDRAVSLGLNLRVRGHNRRNAGFKLTLGSEAVRRVHFENR